MKRLSVFIIFVGMALRAMAQGGEECNFSFAQLFTKDYTLGILSEDLSIISFHNTDIDFLKSTSKKTKIITPPKLYDAFVMINYAYSIAPQSSIGFTMGMYETWGWYVSMAADIDSDFPEYSRSDEDGTSDYFFTGKKNTSRFSLQGGVMYKINYLLATKFGAGYGNRKVVYQTMENEYISIDDKTFNGMELSIGMHLSLKETVFSLDISTIGFSFKYSEIKLGFGYGFEIKGPRLKKQIKL